MPRARIAALVALACLLAGCSSPARSTVTGASVAAERFERQPTTREWVYTAPPIGGVR